MASMCLNCGNSNRAGARFCAVCGQPVSPPPAQQPQPPRSQPPAPQQWSYPPPGPSPWPSQPPAPRPAFPPAQPASPLPAPGSLAPNRPPAGNVLQQLVKPAPIVCGEVLLDPMERFDKPPVDWGRVLIIVCLLSAVIVPFLLEPQAAGQALFVLLILSALCFVPMLVAGMTGFRSVAPMLNPLTWFSLGASLAPRGRQQSSGEVPYLSFKVEDQQTGQTVGVMLVGQRKGGDISLGDKVQIWGHTDRAHSVIRAHRVLVDQSMGRPAGYRISTAKPLPIWIGPAMAVLVVLWWLLAS